MKNTFLSLIILVLGIPAVFAQESSMGMRDLVVNQMFIYGQALYDRGDRIEAKNVFARILQLDPDYSEAQSYARALGMPSNIKRVERSIEKPVKRKVIQEEVLVKEIQETKEVEEMNEVKEDKAQENIVLENQVEPLGIESNQDLVDQIVKEKESIAQLSKEVSTLSADTQAHE